MKQYYVWFEAYSFDIKISGNTMIEVDQPGTFNELISSVENAIKQEVHDDYGVCHKVTIKNIMPCDLIMQQEPEKGAEKQVAEKIIDMIEEQIEEYEEDKRRIAQTMEGHHTVAVCSYACAALLILKQRIYNHYIWKEHDNKDC